MAVRKPKATPHLSRKAVEGDDVMDISQVPVFIPTQEQIDVQMVKLGKFLDEWQKEFGPITQDDLDALERAWPESP